MYSPESWYPNPVELKRKYELQYALKIRHLKVKMKVEIQAAAVRKKILFTSTREQVDYNGTAGSTKTHSLRKTEEPIYIAEKIHGCSV